MKSISCAILLAIAFCLFSCDVPLAPGNGLSNINQSIEPAGLRKLAYMGGSVYYDGDVPGSGPVRKGAEIAFRLGRVEAIEQQDVDRYTDVPSLASYGYMRVLDASPASISFAYELYGEDGLVAAAGERSLSLEQEADLNGDGVLDVRYRVPSISRLGLEGAVYLDFLSSKESGTTTMFALIPEQYPDGDYPNGCMGINNDGKFIFTSRSGDGSRKSLVKGYLPGDYVLDPASGTYSVVIAADRGGAARSLEPTELVSLSEDSPSILYRNNEFATGGAKRLFDSISARYGAFGDAQDDEDAVSALNALLSDHSMARRFEEVAPGPIPSEALPEVLENLPGMPPDALAYFNRMYLQTVFPDLSPSSKYPRIH